MTLSAFRADEGMVNAYFKSRDKMPCNTYRLRNGAHPGMQSERFGRVTNRAVTFF